MSLRQEKGEILKIFSAAAGAALSVIGKQYIHPDGET